MADHIKIGDISPRVIDRGDGVKKTFGFQFAVFKDTDLEVYVDGALQTLSTDYTVLRTEQVAGGTVEFAVAPGDQVPVVLVRRLPIERTSDFQESGAFRSKVINDELDYLTAALQQVADDQSRSVQLPTSDGASNMTLPDTASRAGRILSFDSIGGVALSSPDSLSLATLQAFMDWKVETFTGDGATSDFTLSAEPGQVANTQVFWDGVYQSKTNYTILGNALSFTTAPPMGTKVEVVYGAASSTYVPADGSIADAKISDLNWSKITGTPSTVAGYGITDFATNVVGSGAAMLGSNGDFTVNVKATTAGTALSLWGIQSGNHAGLYIQQTGGAAFTGSNGLAAADINVAAGSTGIAARVRNAGTGYTFVCDEDFKVGKTAAAIDFVYATGGASGTVGNGAQGASATVSISHGTKGAGTHNFYSDWLSTNSLQFQVNTISSAAVNYVQVYGNSTGAPPVVAVEGSDPNISMYIDSKGATGIYFRGNGAAIQHCVASVASAVNYSQLYGSVTGSGLVDTAVGSDANIHRAFSTKGTGVSYMTAGQHQFITSGGAQFIVNDVASAVNYGSLQGGPTGGWPILTWGGSDATVSSATTTKGAGSQYFYTNSTTNRQFQLTHTASAINYPSVTGSPTAGNPVWSVDGSDATLTHQHNAKGAGSHSFYGSGTLQFIVAPLASAVSHFQVNGGATASGVAQRVNSAEANAWALMYSKGAGGFQFYGQGDTTQFRLNPVASAVNYPQISGAATGGNPLYQSVGSDANVLLWLSDQGSGGTAISSASCTAFKVAPVTGAVNYLQVAGAATATSARISVQGTDANNSLDYTIKGTAGYHSFKSRDGGNHILGIGEGYGGTGLIYFPNQSPPTVTAVSGGLLYVEAGALKYRGSSGTITTLGAA